MTHKNISLIENSTSIAFPISMKPGESKIFAIKLRYPHQIYEKAYVIFSAGFPNSSGGVTYFGDHINILIDAFNANENDKYSK